MKIGIESYYGDKTLVNDKNYLLEDIKQMFNNTYILTKSENISEKMAKMYGFIVNDYDPTDKYDYFIDIDICKVSTSHY